MSRLLATLRPLTRTPTQPSSLLPRAPPVRTYSDAPFQQGPAPPRLPADEQAEFERLQREAEAALSSHATAKPTPQQPPPADEEEKSEGTISASTLSGGIRKGAPPEFEGEKNPKTGEVGGPKNEPLRWGSAGDWSYNGRVTDF